MIPRKGINSADGYGKSSAIRFCIICGAGLAWIAGSRATLLQPKNFRHQIFSAKLFAAGQNKGRIAIIEIQHIDHKSKLLLIRRDEIEHLLLVGDGKTLVIESGIKHAS